MKLAKMTLIGTMLFVPAMAMGIAQQDPAQPNQLQQAPAAHPGMNQEFVGTIAEVRDDSFSVKKDSDQSVVWFSITPALKSSYAAELVTGNHVRVSATAGVSPDRMAASSITAEAADSTAKANLDNDVDKDTDIDADINVDDDSVTASIDRDTTIEDNDADVQVAQNDTDNSLRQDSDTYDNDADDDELPQTASSLPAIGALGLLALLGAVAVAFVRKF